jgi:hypothetical protein
VTSRTVLFSDLAGAARRIVDVARSRGADVRVLGSVAVALLCETAVPVGAIRGVWKDLDLVCSPAAYPSMAKLLATVGFGSDPGVELATDGTRALFRGGDQGQLAIDLFVDPIELCHRIELGRRLSFGDLTVTPSDLLLTKLQRVDLRPWDRFDVCLLLATCPLGADHASNVELDYVAETLCNDWGFWKTARENLVSIMEASNSSDEVGEGPPQVTAQVARESARVAGDIVRAIDGAKKSTRWLLRSVLGTAVPWYRTVDSPEVF